jgi:hypothetical protein
LDRVGFPAIRTFDSSRTPKRGERLATPRTLAEVDLTAIMTALAARKTEDHSTGPKEERRRQAELERELAVAKARTEALEQENRNLNSRLAQIAALAADAEPIAASSYPDPGRKPESKRDRPMRLAPPTDAASGEMHPAARKLLIAAAQHAPGRFTWGQLATLAGLKPSGGHFNAGRKELRGALYVAENDGLVTATAEGIKAAGEVPQSPSTPAERLALWCDRLPSPAPEILRALAAQRGAYMDANELAHRLGKKPSGGHWNSGIAVLRNNGLIETDGRRYRTAVLLRE